MRFSSILSVLYIHAIVVTRRIVLDQFNVLCLCIDVLFLSVSICLHVCLLLCFVLAMCSWVDVDPSEEPQYQYREKPSSEQFEQQPEQYEEGKCNMNNPSLLNIFTYYILILYAYKDYLATLYPLYIPLGCILVSCARCRAITHNGPF